MHDETEILDRDSELRTTQKDYHSVGDNFRAVCVKDYLRGHCGHRKDFLIELFKSLHRILPSRV